MIVSTKPIPPIIAIEMPHGWEAIPTAINGFPTRYATIDQEGTLTVWATPHAPTIDGPEGGKVWAYNTENLYTVCYCVDGGDSYPRYMESLRKLTLVV